MKASEADKYKDAPDLADLDAAGEGGPMHGMAMAEGGDHDHGEAAEGHGHSMETVRCATHCGHEIVIKTCYEITVDGKPLAAHLTVDDEGNLHSHALPEYAFSSAVHVVKKIIEAFPDEFPCDDHAKSDGPGHGGSNSPSGQQGHGHDGHTHEHP
jgi:hypothetical protein